MNYIYIFVYWIFGNIIRMYDYCINPKQYFTQAEETGPKVSGSKRAFLNKRVTGNGAGGEERQGGGGGPRGNQV